MDVNSTIRAAATMGNPPPTEPILYILMLYSRNPTFTYMIMSVTVTFRSSLTTFLYPTGYPPHDLNTFLETASNSSLHTPPTPYVPLSSNDQNLKHERPSALIRKSIRRTSRKTDAIALVHQLSPNASIRRCLHEKTKPTANEHNWVDDNQELVRQDRSNTLCYLFLSVSLEASFGTSRITCAYPVDLVTAGQAQRNPPRRKTAAGSHPASGLFKATPRICGKRYAFALPRPLHITIKTTTTTIGELQQSSWTLTGSKGSPSTPVTSSQNSRLKENLLFQYIPDA